MFKKLLFVSAFSLITLPALASMPELLSRHHDWNTYTFTENGQKVCYMASKPVTAEGNYTRRGDIFAMITHRPSEGTKNVFSYATGYPYKSGSSVTVDIDGREFTLFTNGETAWATDPQTDNAITDAIRQGSNMIVKGRSSRGTLTTDTFSLKGSSAAHDKITSTCY